MKIHIDGIDRDMTENEKSEFEQFQKAVAAINKAEAKAAIERATAKQAVLDRLGITADEAALLLG